MEIFSADSTEVKHWYIPAIAGALIIVVGAPLFTVSAELYAVVSSVISISFILSGLLDVVFSLANKPSLCSRSWYMTGGILTILIAVILISLPNVSETLLALFAGFVVLFRSTQVLGFALDLKSRGGKWLWAAFTGMLGILFSILLIMHPLFVHLSLSVLTSLAFLFAGVSNIALAFNLKTSKAA